jgi:hypothetical protein
MKLHLAMNDVQDAETDLAKQLVTLADRHHAEPDVYHQSVEQARRCAERVSQLRSFADRYHARTVDVAGATNPGFLDTLRQSVAAAVAHTPAAAVALVHDLRDSYITAHRTEIAWIILLQGAKAARDGELINVVETCHEEAEQTWKWLRTRIKDSAAQALATN